MKNELENNECVFVGDQSGNAPLATAAGASTTMLDMAPPAILSAPPTPSGLFAAFQRRWRLALLLSLTCAVLGAAVVWKQPVPYRIRTLLHVATIRPFILYESQDRLDFNAYQRSQMSLVRSRLVLNHALQDPTVATLPIVINQQNPLPWLEKLIQVDFQNGPEIMSISIISDQADSPEDWIALVNAVRESYLKDIVNKEKNQRLTRLDQLKVLYAKYDDEIRTKRLKVKELAESLGSKKSQGLQLKQQFMYTQLDTLQKEHTQFQSQTRKLKVESQTIEIKLKMLKEAALPPDDVEEKLNRHPELLKLKASLDERQSRLHTLKDRLRNSEADPAFLAESRILTELKQALENRREALRPGITQQLRDAMIVQLTGSLAILKEQLAMVTELESILDEQINRQVQNIDTVSKGSVNLEWLDEEIALTAEVHKRIGTQREALQVETEAPPRISLLESAYAVPTRDRMDKIKSAGMTAIGLFGMGILAVTLLEFRSRRVNTVADVVHGLGFNLVGALPRVPVHVLRDASPLSRDTSWRRTLRESVDATRTMLIHASKRQNLRIIMITSALKGEGKTLLASHLAVSLARGGLRTLLIDADLRHPAVHRHFGLSVGPGFGEYLRGELRLRDVVHKEISPCLSVVTAGEWDENVTTLLSQSHLRTILTKALRYFDFILIDTTPVLPVPDAMLVAQHVDGVLFSVLRHVSRIPTVYAAYEQLASFDIPILGAVVAGTPVESYRHQYDRPAKNGAQ